MKFKSHFYFEEKDRVAEAAKELEPLPEAKITFFINGESQGVAFTDIFAVRPKEKVVISQQVN